MKCPKCKSKAKEILPAWFECANGHEWIDNGYLNKKYNRRPTKRQPDAVKVAARKGKSPSRKAGRAQ
jgi:hypothetical protein